MSGGGVPQTRIELVPPDLVALPAGAGGIDHVVRYDSGRPGPEVVINALCHGNEICGAVVLERLISAGIRPLVGRLTLVAANVAAYRRFDPVRPFASRQVDEDLNRVWCDSLLDGPGDSAERRRARVLRPVYRQADALLDLHSMANPCEPLLLCGRTPRALALARALGHPRWLIRDSGHAGGRRLIDYGAFAAPDGRSVALLAECGQHWRAGSAEVALTLSLRFLAQFGLIAPGTAAELMPAEAAPAAEPGAARVVDITDVVTAVDDGFVFAADYAGLEVIRHAGTIFGYEQGRPLRTPYDDCVLVMPARTARRGETVVRLGRMLAS